MKTIQLFNPEKFGIAMAGISFREPGEECKLVVFRGKNIIFKKDYANPENAKRGFANRFKSNNGTKPLWPGFTLDHDYKKGKKVKENPVEKAVEYIISRKNEELKNLTAADVAAAKQTDLKEFAQLFEKEQKIPIPAFIQREKLHRAYFILNKGIDVSIPDLAAQLGFPSTAEFEKEFEGYFLATPEKFKELAKNRIVGKNKRIQTP